MALIPISPITLPGPSGLDLIGRGLGNLAGALAQREKQAKEELVNQQLAQLLAGTPGQIGAGTGFAGSPELGGQTNSGTSGLIPGLSPQDALALVTAGVAPDVIAAAFEQRLQPPEPLKVGPGDILLDPNTRQPIFTAPSLPLSSAGKIAADLDVDIRTPEGLAAVERVLRSGGTTINIGNKPIEGSAAAPLVALPGVIAELPQIEDYLFPNGKFDRTRAGILMVPGLRELSGAGGVYAAMRNAVMAKLRRESGAQISDREIDEQLSVYLPSPLDSDEAAHSKYERFKREILGTLETSAQGRVATPPPPPNVPPLTSAQPNAVESAIDRGTGLLPDGSLVPPTIRREELSSLPAQGVEGALPVPKPGDIEDGFRFKGGDWRDPNAWEKVR